MDDGFIDSKTNNNEAVVQRFPGLAFVNNMVPANLKVFLKGKLRILGFELDGVLRKLNGKVANSNYEDYLFSQDIIEALNVQIDLIERSTGRDLSGWKK